MAPTQRTIRLSTGLDYHILEWGAGDPALSHTVFLIHGFLDIAWGWVPAVESALAGELHVVAPDMRGHGDSDRVGAGAYYHFMDYLADLDDLVAQLGRERVSLVGHSMGGSICGYYAGVFPERVHRLALLEGAGPPEMPMSAPDRVKTWLAGWEQARTRTPRTYATLDEAAARLRKNDPLLSEQLALELAAHGTRSIAGGYQFKHDPVHVTLGPYPFLVDIAKQFWSRITCPVLIVEGAESTFRYSPDEAARRYDAFLNAERVVLEGAAHMMQRHQPEKLGELLADHLR